MQDTFSRGINMLCIDPKSVWVDSYWSKIVFVRSVMVWVDANLFVSTWKVDTWVKPHFDQFKACYTYFMSCTHLCQTQWDTYITHICNHKNSSKKKGCSQTPPFWWWQILAGCVMIGETLPLSNTPPEFVHDCTNTFPSLTSLLFFSPFVNIKKRKRLCVGSSDFQV